LIILYHFRWLGNLNELETYIKNIRDIAERIYGAKVEDVLIPPDGWNFVIIYKATDLDKIIEIHRTYQAEYGPSKALLFKIELMYTPRELGMVK